MELNFNDSSFFTTKKTLLAVFAILLSFGRLCFAKVEIGDSLKVSSEVESWTEIFSQKVASMRLQKTYSPYGYTECRETIEIKSTYLCMSATQKGMAMHLSRAVYFIEGFGPGTQGKVIGHNDSKYLKISSNLGGFDLKGKDLLKFYNMVNQVCKTQNYDPNICFSENEKEIFKNLILPRALRDPKFVVITFGLQSFMDWRDVVTHEILHAQYFSDDRFKLVTDTFWDRNVLTEDKNEIVNLLSTSYDPTDEALIKNEFQAYMLMTGSESSTLKAYVKTYGYALGAALKQAGIVPIQVQ